eukprot:2620537-Lingulodinium_polyedra.AAC.1
MNADGRQGRFGIFGLERDFGSGNMAHQRAMEVIIERLCIPSVCNPHAVVGGRAPQPRDAAHIIENPSNLAVRDSGGEGDAVDH